MAKWKTFTKKINSPKGVLQNNLKILLEPLRIYLEQYSYSVSFRLTNCDYVKVICVKNDAKAEWFILPALVLSQDTKDTYIKNAKALFEFELETARHGFKTSCWSFKGPLPNALVKPKKASLLFDKNGTVRPI